MLQMSLDLSTCQNGKTSKVRNPGGLVILEKGIGGARRRSVILSRCKCRTPLGCFLCQGVGVGYLFEVFPNITQIELQLSYKASS